MANNVVVHAGEHSRHMCPVRVPSGGTPPGRLRSGSSTVACQPDGDAYTFIAPTLAAGCAVEYSADCDVSSGPAVTLTDDGGSIRVDDAGALVTAYHYADVPARPYFWPLLAPGATPVTRAWPLNSDVPGETNDHKHHRSMYFAFGEVNGVDNWSEEAGHGHTVHQRIDELTSGPVFGRFRTTSDWTSPTGAKILTQHASVTFWRGSDSLRLIDVDLSLVADCGDVHFGDTKEGGLLSVRVATSMDVPRGGRITNSYGGANEPETWGYSAHWCDYSGVVDGRSVGIAIMDHPSSFRYPTYWHVRDYGLMTANPFALKEYTRGIKEGSHTLRADQTLRFVYRVALHVGDACAADVAGRYVDFVHPPRVVPTS